MTSMYLPFRRVLVGGADGSIEDLVLDLSENALKRV